MTKLAKYLKPFTLGLVLAIILLFAQAICDLNLPNYMSDIVNVGLQQNGIEHAAPNAISQNGMKLMTTFMTDSEKQNVDENYSLVQNTDTNANGTTYNKLYPKAGQQIFVKKDTNEITNTGLDNAFGAATWTMMSVLQDMEKQSGQSNADTATTNIKSFRHNKALSAPARIKQSARGFHKHRT